MPSSSRRVAPQIDASPSRRSRPVEGSYRAPAKAAPKVEDYLEQPSSTPGDARLLTSRLYVSFAEFSSSALEQLHIAAPYVRTEALDVILRPINIRDVKIITTWTVHDCCKALPIKIFILTSDRVAGIYIFIRHYTPKY